MDPQDFKPEFIYHALYRINENCDKIKFCLEELDDEEVWMRPNDSSNSIGNQILHLCGNITQYIISSLGGSEDKRERDAEFSARDGLSKEQLWNKFSQTIEQAKSIIENISDEKLAATRSVQGFQFSGIGIVFHVVEHLSYHTGQIAFYVKQLKNKDLGFYNNVDLNTKNKI
jgi:uncharacterized damage-inducible protein DinB